MPIWTDPDAPTPVPPVVVESPDGKLTAILDPAHGGIGFLVDLSDESPLPFKARIYRNGAPIMGADPAWVAFGVGELYDRFPMIGVNTYRVAAVHDDGSEGPLSDPVSIVLPDLEPGMDVWLRSLNDASLSMLLPGVEDRPVRALAGNVSLERAVGSQLPGGAMDVWSPKPIEVPTVTRTLADLEQLQLLIQSGVLHLQVRSTYGIPDMWCIAMESEASVPGPIERPLRLHRLTLQPVLEPPTIDSPVQIPGRSYGDTTATGQDYAASTIRWPLYADRTGLSLPPPVLLRTNLHPNPFAVGLAGWSVTSRTVTTAAATVLAGMTATVTGTGTGRVVVWTQESETTPVAAGDSLPVSALVHVSRAGLVQVQVEWRTDSGDLSYTPTVWVSVAADTVTELTVATTTVPATATSARVVVSADGASLTTGDRVSVGGVMMGATGVPFDGDTDAQGSISYKWAGTPYESASQEWQR